MPAPPAERPPVRVVETERTKKAQDIVAQRAAALKRGTPAQPTPNAALEAFAARLREATLKNDAAGIRAALQEVAAAEGNDLGARLRLLAGLSPPAGGEVRWRGVPLPASRGSTL